MQKGYKRTGKAIAVLHFFIGLIVVAILLVAAYFCLEKMDYSHRINPDTTVRAYVEMTATPEEPDEEPFSANEDPGDEGSDVVDLIPSTTPTLEPTPTIEPTPIATPSPTPTASPTPTPAPTVISSDLISKSRTRGFKVPDPSNEATAALTEVYVSAPNNNKFVHLTGYAYINDASVDAATSHAYLIVMPSDSKKKAAIAYQGTMTPGISGETHAGAQCQNPANADFDVILSVANFKDAQYTLGVVLQYEKNGKNAFTYYQFPQTLNVANGAIVLTEGAVSATLTETTENADVVGQPVVDAGAMNETATDDLDGTAFGDGGASAFDETAAEGQEANLADAGVSVG